MSTTAAQVLATIRAAHQELMRQAGEVTAAPADLPAHARQVDAVADRIGTAVQAGRARWSLVSGPPGIPDLRAQSAPVRHREPDAAGPSPHLGG